MTPQTATQHYALKRQQDTGHPYFCSGFYDEYDVLRERALLDTPFNRQQVCVWGDTVVTFETTQQVR